MTMTNRAPSLPSMPAPIPIHPPAPTVPTPTSALLAALNAELEALHAEVASKAAVNAKAADVASKAAKVHAAAAGSHQAIVDSLTDAESAFDLAMADDKDGAVIRISRVERELTRSARALAPLAEAASTSASIATSAAASLEDAAARAVALTRDISLLEAASLEALDKAIAPAWGAYLLAVQALVSAGEKIAQIYKGHVELVAAYNSTAKPATPLRAADGGRAALQLVASFADRGVVIDDAYLKTIQTAMTCTSQWGGRIIVDTPGLLCDVVAAAIAHPAVPGATGVGLEARRTFLDALKSVPLVVHAAEITRHRKEETARRQAAEGAPLSVVAPTTNEPPASRSLSDVVDEGMAKGIRRPRTWQSGP